jgi:hypothetical protein
MAIAGASNRGSNANSTSATTQSVTMTAAVAAGEVLLVTTATREDIEVTGVTDSVGNVYRRINRSEHTSANAHVELWVGRAITALTTSHTVTVTYASAVVDKYMAVRRYTVAAGKTLTQDDEAAVQSSEVSAANGFGSTSYASLTSQERLYVKSGAKQANTTTAITVSTSFTSWGLNTRSRNNASAIILRTEERINTSTGETSNPTLAVSGNAVSLFAALVETDAQDGLAAVSGAGTVAATGASIAEASAAITGSGAVAATGEEVTGGGGGAITWVSSSNTTYASRTNTTVTAPSGITDGDVMLALMLTGAAPEAPDFTEPAGWTLIGSRSDVTAGGFNVEMGVYIKVASGESGDYTWTHSSASSQGAIAVFRGVDTTTPQDATSTLNSASGATQSTTTFTGLTTATDGAWIVGLAHDFADATADRTPPTGMTERVEVNPLIYICTEEITTAGATGNRSYTNNNTSGGGDDAWAARLVALRPAAAGTTDGAAAVSGSGAVAATGASTAEASTAIAGSATLSVVGAGIAEGSASVAGSGAVAAVGDVAGTTADGAAAVSGALTVDAVSASFAAADGAVAGSAAVSAGGSSTAEASAAIAGAGSVSATGAAAFEGAASASGSGAVSAAGASIAEASAAIAGSGAVNAVGDGSSLAEGAAAASGAATVSVAGEAVTAGAAASSGAATLAVAGASIFGGAAASSGSAALSVAGASIAAATADIAANGDVAATGSSTAAAGASVSGTAVVDAVGVAGTTEAGSVAIAGAFGLAVVGEAYIFVPVESIRVPVWTSGGAVMVSEAPSRGTVDVPGPGGSGAVAVAIRAENETIRVRRI